jgi:signal peptidase II
MYEFFRFNRLFLFVFLIFIDQVSKYIIRSSGGFYICNEGIAFGIEIYEKLFWIIFIFIFVLFYFFVKKNYAMPAGRRELGIKSQEISKYRIFNISCLILVVSGAVSNLIDRAQYGCVIDFIDLKFFPVFNLADIFISIGATGIVYVLYKKNKADLAL